jgi:hypothetical protein
MPTCSEPQISINKSEKPNDSINPPKYDTVSEGFNLNGGFTLNKLQITKINQGIDAFKKHLAMMIIFVLFGSCCGLYAAKIIYDLRMGEITKVGGFVYDNKVYNVSLRP